MFVQKLFRLCLRTQSLLNVFIIAPVKSIKCNYNVRAMPPPTSHAPRDVIIARETTTVPKISILIWTFQHAVILFL